MERSAPPASVHGTLRPMSAPEVRLYSLEFPDLAPSVYRQRLVLEGRRKHPLVAEEVSQYLTALSDECDMKALIEPVTHRSERYGWSGWVHWEASGAHFYAWDDPVFFSVDVYTCAPFDPGAVARFTAQFFGAEELVGQAF